MKILLLGEYSNVHTTLAKGLRELGHHVTVASDGDGWKDYPRDIDLRRSSLSRLDSLKYWLKVKSAFQKFRGYDVVQIINPLFLNFKAQRILPYFRFLKKHNQCIVMGAFGMDYYYVTGCLDKQTFRYSDFNIGPVERINRDNDQFKQEWLYGFNGELNQIIAKESHAIVTGLYEYDACYRKYYHGSAKLVFIPFPIQMQSIETYYDDSPRLATADPRHKESQFIPGEPLKIFVGIQSQRSAYKGTDILLRAAQRVAQEHPQECVLLKAENVPFETYKHMLDTAHVILDQLYSYTPAMNALEAMARGTVVVGGAEPENYFILNENQLRPIINVQPNEQSVYHAITELVVNRDRLIPQLREEGLAYIHRHHDYLKVARKYEELYKELIEVRA